MSYQLKAYLLVHERDHVNAFKEGRQVGVRHHLLKEQRDDG